MVIHRPGKNVKQVAKLDLGASQNLMSRRLALSLGLHLDDYLGPVLQPIGPAFRPMNRVTFDWHISGKKNVYTSVFTLLDDEKSTEYFDVLLAEDDIAKIGFYRPNRTVFFMRDSVQGPWYADI